MSPEDHGHNNSTIPNSTSGPQDIHNLAEDHMPIFSSLSAWQAYNTSQLPHPHNCCDMNQFSHNVDLDTHANVLQNEVAMILGAGEQHHSLPSALATLAAIDTGASKTYVGRHEKLVDRKLIRGATVKAADGCEMAVLQDGKWHGIKNTRMLDGLDQNLVSPQQVARQHDIMWIMRQDKMTMAPVEPQRDEEVVMANINRNDLFVCDMRKLDDALQNMSFLRGGGIPKPNLNRNFYRQPFHAQGMAFGAKMRVTDMALQVDFDIMI